MLVRVHSCYAFGMAAEKTDEEILREHGIEPDPVIELYKRDVDRTLLRQNLRRSMDERWKVLTEATRLAEEMRRAGARARGR
jgi:hypothetical protein